MEEDTPPKPPNTKPGQVTGDAIPDDEVKMLERFRANFFPDARIASQETYAKWLFGLTTTISALGTGFSNAAFSRLSAWGIFFYSCAILAAGIGLALAAIALSAELSDANWSCLSIMEEALTNLMHRKKNILRWATYCLVGSFVLASGAPFATTIQLRPSRHISGILISITGRSMEAGISLEELRPGTRANLEIDRDSDGKSSLLAGFVQIADDSGKINFKAPSFALSSEQQNLRVTLTYLRGNNLQREEVDFSIPQQEAETKVDSGNARTSAKKSGRPSRSKIAKNCAKTPTA